MIIQPKFQTFFLAICLAILQPVTAQQKTVAIQGKLNGIGNDTMTILVSDFSFQPILEKNVFVKNGEFHCSFEIDALSRVSMECKKMKFLKPDGNLLSMRSKDIFLFAGPGDKIEIQGWVERFSLRLTIKGNPLSEQLADFKNDNIGILEEETRSYLSLLRLQYMGAAKQEIDSVTKIYIGTKEKYNHRRLDYVLQHPDHELAADMLLLQDRDTIEKYHHLLGPKALSTFQGKQLKQTIRSWQQIIEGKELPDLIGKDADGNAINLADYKGKYLLIDFWGSWCGPCLAEMPALINLYRDYKDKISIVGIAVSDNAVNLKNAIWKYKLPWKSILNNQQDPEQDFSLLFNVQAVPAKYLISPEGHFIKEIQVEEGGIKSIIDSILKK